jgi:hypothetical protein
MANAIGWVVASMPPHRFQMSKPPAPIVKTMLFDENA